MSATRYHSICRWTFHAGKGGFLPAHMRPAWGAPALDAPGIVRLIRSQIAPRLPASISLGFELHYDTEVNDESASEVADAMVEAKVALAMITPGAHSHFGYGGIASLDANERARACELGERTVALAYGALRKAWSSDPRLVPTLVLWNGSYGYDLATLAVRRMYQHLKESVARLCEVEAKQGNQLFIGIEPKPNEGHPAMLLPTVASALLFWKRLKEEFGVSLDRKGTNKEIGHSEMIGLDQIYDTVEEIDNNALVHMHLNSQGYNDGITLGGPGKYDIDHGVKINGMNIALAGLIQEARYDRWLGHDMQVRPYDNEAQGVDRVIRSILSWEACEQAARTVDTTELLGHLSARRTAPAEDIMRHAVVTAHRCFDEMYRG